MSIRTQALISLAVALLLCFPAQSQIGAINDADRVVLPASVPGQAQTASDEGLAGSDVPMQRIVLVLSPRPGVAKQRDRFIQDLNDPNSPRYHQWLTPEEYGARFGISDADLGTIINWLKKYGFTIDEVGKGRGWINFSGNVAQVESAFQTQIRQYRLNGQAHHANAAPVSIPRAIAGVVLGPLTLHDFPKKPLHLAAQLVDPNFNSGGHHYLAPADFSTIYNVNPVYAAGTDGTGQTVAIVGRTDINLSDVQTFRSNFGLPANDPAFTHNGTPPGNLGGNEETEADLDVQWSGAVAKNATINFVISASTFSTDGVDLSAQYIVNNNLAPVMSTSFGLCELLMGSSENAFYNNLWAQAAAQGITSFVSSGDSGAAGCDPGNSTSGSIRAVSGLSSTPYNVAVGGTQFMDTSNPSLYWASSNDPVTKGSALSYIPEQAWNESGSVPGGSGLWATGGGASTIYSKPPWQIAPGVPADNKRDVPDVSLTSASHDGYLIYQGGSLFAVGGTSAASPAFAGLLALVNQRTGAQQGNANTIFYPLANNQYNTCAPIVFHDTTVLNNTVPGVTGFNAGPGYDQATGLGSVDATALVNNWVAGANFYICASPGAVSVAQGAAGTSTITTSASGGFNSAITL
ncbi:MAG TPA: S53 family peptidase, partial [Phycisphaerae bacterium]|nr:S53 family peptidase [Phycisphaerae bacterium]